MVFDINKDVSLIGRDVTNDIVLGDSEVSRQHSRLSRTPGGFVLEDMGSTNGTFVNGERLMSPSVLNPGDLIGIGETVTMTFDVTSPESAETVARPAAQPQQPPSPAPSPAPRPTPAQHVAQPAAAPAAPPAEEPSRMPLILAGVGCLFLAMACLAVLWFMDANYPHILYAPLRIFGIQ
jgi:hypothetical protein